MFHYIVNYLMMWVGLAVRHFLMFRQDDVESVVNLQSKGFYEPWDVGWLDSFFLKLFAVSSA